MDFVIEPLTGVGDMRFGMTPEQIRNAMGLPYESFMKSSTSLMPTDSFLDDSIHVFYYSDRRCEAIEFYEPLRIMLNGTYLLGVPYGDAKCAICQFDQEIEEDESGLTSYRLGVGIFAPGHLEDDQIVTQSVIIFEEGYYRRHSGLH